MKTLTVTNNYRSNTHTKFTSTMLVVSTIIGIAVILYPQPSFSFHILQQPQHHTMARLSSRSYSKSYSYSRSHKSNHFVKQQPSALPLFMLSNNNENENISFFQSNDNPKNSFNDTSTSTTTTTTATTTPTTNEPLSSSSFEQALNEAKALKERAEKERLEAEKMRIELTLRKIQVLEQELSKLEVPKPVIVEMEIHDDNNGGISEGKGGEKDEEEEQIKVNLNIVQKSEDLKKQIENLKRQLDDTSSNDMSTPVPSIVTSTPITTATSSSSTTSTSSSTTSTAETPGTSSIPEDEMKKLTHRFKNFPLEIKQLYCQAINLTYKNDDDIQSIIEQLYVLDQQEKQSSSYSNKNNSTLVTPTLLQIAHTQVGFTLLLPQPVQQIFRDSIGMLNEQNVTLVVETLLENNKVIMTEAFGGVEFRFDDDDDESVKKDQQTNSQKQQDEGNSLDRGFTKDEIKEAIDLFDNLPLPMKTMLASGVGLDGSNSTEVIELMIEKKKIKPSTNGVEFLVYDDSISDSKGMLYLLS
jgi:hypothetical protein